MREKRKFFQFQNISRGSQPSTENPHPWQKARLVTSKSRWARRTHPTGHGSSSSGCHRRGRRWECAGRVAPPWHPPRDIVCHRAAAGRVCLGPALCRPALHAHSLPAPCLPRLHRVKTRALSVQLKLCFLKKLLTRLVHISMLRRNMTLFSPLDPPSDPCHPPLQDTRRSLLPAGTWRGCSPPGHSAGLLSAPGARRWGPRSAPRAGRPGEQKVLSPLPGRLSSAGLVPILSREESD